METRAPGALPPRDSIRMRHPSLSFPVVQKLGVAIAVIVAMALAVTAVLFVPRPDVAIEDVAFDTPGCLPAATAQNVRATFTLANRGAADATVQVTFLVDGTTVASQVFAVLGNARLLGQLEATLPNCSLHTYFLSMMYEGYSGG